ncbi:MAG: glycosyltransferase [Chitinophagaceae bacterium]
MALRFKDRPVHLVIPSAVISGLEKRMLDFWLFSQKEYKRQFFLVTTKEIYSQATASEDFAGIVQYKDKVLFIEHTDSRAKRLKVIRQYFFRYKKEAIMHFTMWFPVNFSLRRYRTLYTFPGSELSYMSFVTRSVLYLSFLRSTKSDLLDPIIFNNMRKLFFFKKKSFTLTTNSIVDSEKYTADFANKKNWIVFSGRLVALKQVIPYVKALPLVHSKLSEKGVADVKFYIMGYGEQEEELKELLKDDVYKGMDIFFDFVPDPRSVLEKSKIIISVQLYNNYPSRSLLEAMACGNIPVVTDVGNTDLIAKPEFSEYVPKDFSSQDIADAIVSVLTMPEEKQLEKMRTARQFVVENCKMKNMADYFHRLYDELEN